jgi:hypothetical protein
MKMSLRCLLLAALVALAPTTAAVAATIDVPTLQRLLQQAPRQSLQFQETRESPWLAAPVESSGRISFKAGVLEKIVERPRRETWRILPDRLELLAEGASSPKQLLFRDVPALAALANALRQAVAGDLAALEKDFTLRAEGDERLWTLQLVPRRTETARIVRQLDLQGTGALLRVIVILENQGERTTTRLSAEP